jgi:Sec-independent protein translocase protein TatA
MVEGTGVILGMTHGELGLVLFIFALVYGAQVLPKLGERVGTWLARKR